jgi:predicted transcriptional regulator
MKSGQQYRIFENELRCSSGFDKVWRAILGKLPKISRAFSVDGHSLNNRLLISIKAEYAKKVFSGEKKVEIRRRFSKRWTGCKVSVYASGHERCLVGEVSISRVVVDKPESIWEKFHQQIGCTREEFDRYTQSLNEIYAVVLENAMPYRKHISLSEVSSLTKRKLRPPQNYYILNNNVNWAEVVSLGALLQSRFRSQEPVLL